MVAALFRSRRFNDEKMEWEEVDEPVHVGDGVSYGIGGDAYPYTVRKISPSGKTVWCSRDDFKGDGNNTYAEATKSGTFTPRDEDRPDCWRVFTKRKDGRWRQKGDSIRSAGHLFAGRVYRQDPHF